MIEEGISPSLLGNKKMAEKNATETTKDDGSWWDTLWGGIVDVSKVASAAYVTASTVGNSSPATTTTSSTPAADTFTIGGVTVTPMGIIFTVGGVLGAIVLANFAMKALK